MSVDLVTTSKYQCTREIHPRTARPLDTTIRFRCCTTILILRPFKNEKAVNTCSNQRKGGINNCFSYYETDKNLRNDTLYRQGRERARGDTYKTRRNRRGRHRRYPNAKNVNCLTPPPFTRACEFEK